MIRLLCFVLAVLAASPCGPIGTVDGSSEYTPTSDALPSEGRGELLLMSGGVDKASETKLLAKLEGSGKIAFVVTEAPRKQA